MIFSSCSFSICKNFPLSGTSNFLTPNHYFSVLASDNHILSEARSCVKILWGIHKTTPKFYFFREIFVSGYDTILLFSSRFSFDDPIITRNRMDIMKKIKNESIPHLSLSNFSLLTIMFVHSLKLTLHTLTMDKPLKKYYEMRLYFWLITIFKTNKQTPQVLVQ